MTFVPHIDPTAATPLIGAAAMTAVLVWFARRHALRYAGHWAGAWAALLGGWFASFFAPATIVLPVLANVAFAALIVMGGRSDRRPTAERDSVAARFRYGCVALSLTAVSLELFARQTAIANAFFMLAAIATFVCICRDEHQRHVASLMAVERLAYSDALTGLPNRALFLDRATMALAQTRRSLSSAAILFVDLDGFKLVNDSFGHAAGDELLRVVAARLRDAVREIDTVSRFGGDEFTLLLMGLRDGRDAAAVAEKIAATLRIPVLIGGRDVHVTGSIGMTIYPGDGSDAETLIRNADAAMYRAKQRGGNNVQLYTPDLDQERLATLKLEAALRHALTENEFVVHYQPRVDTVSRTVVAFEALLRWNEPRRGLLLPHDFIDVCEGSGLIVPIGHWVLRQACQQAKSWHDAGARHLVVAVNISPRQLQERDLPLVIEQALVAARLEPRYLELEIDESYVMAHAETCMRILRELKATGVRILFSGFGAGFSSLNYLRRFPIDGLKLDRSFVTASTENRTLASAALGMARALSLSVVGEGVETQEAAEFLQQNSCDNIQGFLVSGALPADGCSQFIAQGNAAVGLNPSHDVLAVSA